MSRLTLLLPERRRLAGQALSKPVARALARADRLEWSPDATAVSSSAQLRRYFAGIPDDWPIAALTRQLDAGDAGAALWVRVDPVHVRAELTGVRLMAHGTLGVSNAEAASLTEALQPLFAEQGWQVSAPHPQRWYLKLPPDLVLPALTAPESVLGDDLFAHMPQGDVGRRWRALINETQIVLHQHEVNQQRLAAGQLPVNSVWFWGGGVLPEPLIGAVDAVESDEADLLALAMHAKPASDAAGHRLVDVRDARVWSSLESVHLLPALAALRDGQLSQAMLDFADGIGYQLHHGQRWRFWRRALDRLA